MNEKSEALRLADLLQDEQGVYVYVCDDAAAELRRLAAVEAQRDALLDEIQTHSAAVYECTRLLAEARAQRDALLEALRAMRVKYGQYACRVCDLADAAIKAVEEGK